MRRREHRAPRPLSRSPLRATRVGAAAHSVDGNCVRWLPSSAHVSSCYIAVHNVDSSLCSTRSSDSYARLRTVSKPKLKDSKTRRSSQARNRPRNRGSSMATR
jgi:hypothetical protein